MRVEVKMPMVCVRGCVEFDREGNYYTTRVGIRACVLRCVYNETA